MIAASPPIVAACPCWVSHCWQLGWLLLPVPVANEMPMGKVLLSALPGWSQGHLLLVVGLAIAFNGARFCCTAEPHHRHILAGDRDVLGPHLLARLCKAELLLEQKNCFTINLPASCIHCPGCKCMPGQADSIQHQSMQCLCMLWC